jgi:hypothetical protein
VVFHGDNVEYSYTGPEPFALKEFDKGVASHLSKFVAAVLHPRRR